MARPTPAPLFLPLILPFGIVVGYATVTTPYILDKLGFLAVVATAAQQTGQLPHTIKIFWAPALDAAGLRKHWFMASLVIAATALAATALVDAKAHLSLYTGLLFVANIGAATSSAAIDALMAVTVPAERKGAAAGWSMAGNLGGTGIGGAAALWLTQHQSPPVTAAALAGLILLCGAPVLWIDEERRPRKPVLESVAGLAKDLFRTAVSRPGWTGIIICITPMATGAAANLFAGSMHNDYRASEHQVEIVTGLLGGGVSALGCLLGGYIADLMNRRLAYGMAGALMAIVGAIMAFSPHTPTVFTIGTLTYQFCNGIGYAAFAAFVLEMIGHEGAVATKYTLFVACANWAISYTSVLDGWGYDRAKVKGLFLTDAASNLAAILVLGLMMLIVGRVKKPAEVPAAAAGG